MRIGRISSSSSPTPRLLVLIANPLDMNSCAYVLHIMRSITKENDRIMAMEYLGVPPSGSPRLAAGQIQTAARLKWISSV
jgi:hypothetical protein